MANRFPLIFNSGAGQIQELAASDNLDLTSSNLVNAGILFTSSGSVTAPSLQIGSGTTYNPGLYSPGTDQLAVATNGTQKLIILSDGKTGIGVSDPGQALVIGGGTNGRARIKVTSSASNYGKFEFSTDSSSTASTAQVAEITANIVGTGPLTSSLGFATNAGNSLNTAMTIDSSQRVGIGNSSPGAKLDVSGSGNLVRLGDGTNTFDVRFQGPNNWSTQLDTSADKFNIQRNSTSLVTVDSAGRLGIGTTSPTTKLDIYTGSATGTYVKVENTEGRLFAGVYGTGEGYLATETSDPLVLGTNGTEKARLDTSGRLLIGTSTNYSLPAALVVSGYDGTATNRQGIIQLVREDTAITTDDVIGELRFSGSESGTGGQCAFITAQADAEWTAGDYPGRLVFSTTADGASSPTERMRITQMGALNVAADGGTFGGGTATARFSSIAAASANYSNQQVVVFHNKGTSGTRYIASFGDGATYTERGFITWDGSNMALVNASDKRLKTNIFEANSAVESIKQINVRSFDFIENGNHVDYGFIAQELHESAPEAVNVGADDASGNIDKPWTVGYASLVPRLTKALQEAITKIETLEARLTAAGID